VVQRIHVQRQGVQQYLSLACTMIHLGSSLWDLAACMRAIDSAVNICRQLGMIGLHRLGLCSSTLHGLVFQQSSWFDAHLSCSHSGVTKAPKSLWELIASIGVSLALVQKSEWMRLHQVE